MGHKKVVVANQAQMGHGVQKGVKVLHSAKMFSLKKVLGGDEHLGLCFSVQTTVTERKLALWICVQPSRQVFVIQHSET